MARAEELEEVANTPESEVPPSPKASDAGDAPDDKQSVDGDEEEEGEQEEEYEIEGILEAKRGLYRKGQFAYLVKWKNYSAEHNSWVREEDAGNARDLISEFWRVREAERKGSRKSFDNGRALDSPAPAPKRGRKSIADKDKASREKSEPLASDVEETITAVSKRRRGTSEKANTKASSDNDEEPAEADEEESARAKKKKPRASTGGSVSVAKKKEAKEVKGAKGSKEVKIDQDGDVAMANGKDVSDDDDRQPPGGFKSMAKYMGKKTWESLVKHVDTVERDRESGDLMVFFTLETGEQIREKSSLCNERFPQQLLRFYESNLRWKLIGE